MTGAELLAQVREGLSTWGTDWYGPNPDYHPRRQRAANALHALDGCVLLTADEAEKVRGAISMRGLLFKDEHEALALLTPAGKDEWQYTETPTSGVCETCGRAK